MFLTYLGTNVPETAFGYDMLVCAVFDVSLDDRP